MSENHHRNQNYQAYTRDIGDIPLLTREDEIRLATSLKSGCKKAKDQLIEANLRLVIKIAGDYCNLGLPMMDLISEGNLGLIKAIDRYDPDKGKLSTYAACWIKQSIKRALANQSKTVRVPVHMVDKLAQLDKVAYKLSAQLQRDPSDEELSDALGIAEKRIRHMRASRHTHVPLDSPASPGTKKLYSETLSDPESKNPFETLASEEMLGRIPEMLAQLDDRERRILKYRFGLGGGKEKTLEQVGEKFGVTRERIRQIQDEAIKKMSDYVKSLERSPRRTL